MDATRIDSDRIREELAYENNIVELKRLYNGRFNTIDLIHHKAFPLKMFVRKTTDLKKYMKITKIKPEDYDKYLRILQRKNHANIIRLFTYLTDESSYTFYTVFMKYYERGSVQDIMNKTKKPIDSSVIKIWMCKLLSAIHFLHERCIAHRNLRLTSFLVTSNNDIILSGFGKQVSGFNFAYEVMRLTVFNDVVYQAPEMSNICTSVWPYNARFTDMWAIGVCLFMMINFDPPFTQALYDEDKLLFLQNQRNSVYNFNNSYCTEQNLSLRQLVKYFLEPLPAKRITASQALTHSSLFQ